MLSVSFEHLSQMCAGYFPMTSTMSVFFSAFILSGNQLRPGVRFTTVHLYGRIPHWDLQDVNMLLPELFKNNWKYFVPY